MRTKTKMGGRELWLIATGTTDERTRTGKQMKTMRVRMEVEFGGFLSDSASLLLLCEQGTTISPSLSRERARMPQSLIVDRTATPTTPDCRWSLHASAVCPDGNSSNLWHLHSLFSDRRSLSGRYVLHRALSIPFGPPVLPPSSFFPSFSRATDNAITLFRRTPTASRTRRRDRPLAGHRPQAAGQNASDHSLAGRRRRAGQEDASDHSLAKQRRRAAGRKRNPCKQVSTRHESAPLA